MLLRILSRRALATSYQFLKFSNETLISFAQTESLQTYNYPSFTNALVPFRPYSKPVNIEEISVDFDYVKKAINDQNIIIIDVREPNEVIEYGKIPSSINIPLGNVTTVLSSMSEKEFNKQYSREKPSEETEIIFYCMIGRRSGMAQQNAINIGYKNVKNYLGSFTDWANKTR